MKGLTEPELAWAIRERRSPQFDLDERLERAGYVRCPGPRGRGCLALLPIDSPQYLCNFCRGTLQRAV